MFFQVGNRVGVKRCNDDTMHIFIDGEDMGPAATAVAKVTHSLTHSHDTKTNDSTKPSSTVFLLLAECLRRFGPLRADNGGVHRQLLADGGHGERQGAVAVLGQLQ